MLFNLEKKRKQLGINILEVLSTEVSAMPDDEIAIEVERKTDKFMPLGANEMRHAINTLLENGWIEQAGERAVSVLGREEMQSLYCITSLGRNALTDAKC